MKTVHIVASRISNLFNISDAVRNIGYDVKLVHSADDMKDAGFLLLPGVGAFRDGIRVLGENGLAEGIHEHVSKGRPLLGICLGMQLLMQKSEEFGEYKGLGLIGGTARRFPNEDKEGHACKVPNVGWMQVRAENNDPKYDTIRDSVNDRYFYLVHSYYVVPDNTQDVFATASYGGLDYCVMIQKQNIWGCQFHPELSAHAGLNLLNKIIEGAGKV